MTETVKIQMKGVQVYVDGDGSEEESKSNTQGELLQREDCIYVTFREKNEEEQVEMQSLLKIKSDVVELTRKGQLNAKLIFEKGKKHGSTYITPYGQMSLAVETFELSVLKSEKNMHIQIEYATDLEGRKIADNKMSIVIRSEHPIFD